MIEIHDKTKCCGCHACYSICPVNCITMVDDNEGFQYPKVDFDICINCNSCIDVCPIINRSNSNVEPSVYAAYSKDDDERSNSSSGGIFPLMAKNIISKGGVVFGAAFDESFNVRHICIESVEDLYSLQGSKYVQSTIGESYKMARDYLKEGRNVYFSGTPCQVEGLLAYLGKKYDNLITQDSVCHGVPSKKIWHKYLSGFMSISDISFRDKSTGWSTYSLRIGNYLIKASKSSYMKAFIDGYSLRPSCYKCKFKSKKRVSDITLGDLWGADYIAPDMNDNKGLSLVSINTKKGMMLFNEICQNIEYKTINIEDAIKFNSSYIKPTNQPLKRDEFFRDAETHSIDKIINEKYCRTNIVSKVISRIRGLMINK